MEQSQPRLREGGNGPGHCAGLLQGAQAKSNKRQVKDLERSAAAAEKNVEAAHVALDATPKTVTENVIRPYTYIERRSR